MGRHNMDSDDAGLNLTGQRVTLRGPRGRSVRVDPVPARFNVRVTDVCDLACSMCGQASRRARHGVDPVEFSVDALRAYLAPRPRHFDGEAYVWGGEPLLRDDLPLLVDVLCEAGLRVAVNTNGSRLIERIEELSSVDTWILSIDGPPPVHDRIRGRIGLFDRIDEGLRALEALPSRPERVINFTVTAENHDRILETLDTGIPFDRWVLQFPTFTTSVTGAIYEKGLASHLGIDAGPAWRSFRGMGADVDAERLAEQVNGLYDRLGERLQMTPYRVRDAQAIRRYFDDPQAIVSRKRGTCLALGTEVSIEPDGRLVGCPDFPDVVVGHLDDKPWPAPWGDDALDRLRSAFLADDLGVCGRCCRFF